MLLFFSYKREFLYNNKTSEEKKKTLNKMLNQNKSSKEQTRANERT